MENNLVKDCVESYNSSDNKNIMDIIFRRSIQERFQTYCHYSVVKDLKIDNFKYEGTWAFIQVLGCNQFFSSLFALLTIISNIVSYYTILKPNLQNDFISRMLQGQFHIINITFFNSLCFHIQENKITSYLDYTSAVSLAIYSCFSFLILSLHLKSNKLLEKFKLPLTYSFILFFLYFLIYVAFCTLNFTAARIVCVVFAVLMFACLFYIFFKKRKDGCVVYLIMFIFLIVMGFIAEMKDTPPEYFLIDSHSMWHLCYVFIPCFYYLFWSRILKSKENQLSSISEV